MRVRDRVEGRAKEVEGAEEVRPLAMMRRP